MRNEQTSPAVAEWAGRLNRLSVRDLQTMISEDAQVARAVKSIIASALTQAPDRDAQRRYGRQDYGADQVPEDEPVFLIRGQDAVGAEAVLAWADLAERRGADKATVRSARLHAERMAEWPVKKLPDLR